MLKKLKNNKLLNAVKALLLPICVYLLMALITKGRFGSLDSLISLIRTSMVPIMLGMSLSFGTNMGMWNFATGAVVYTSAILSAHYSNLLGWGIPGMCLISVVVALVLNLFTGFLYNKLRVPCLVLSLGLTMIFEALPSLLVENSTGTIKLLDGYLAHRPGVS